MPKLLKLIHVRTIFYSLQLLAHIAWKTICYSMEVMCLENNMQYSRQRYYLMYGSTNTSTLSKSISNTIHLSGEFKKTSAQCFADSFRISLLYMIFNCTAKLPRPWRQHFVQTFECRVESDHHSKTLRRLGNPNRTGNKTPCFIDQPKAFAKEAGY